MEDDRVEYGTWRMQEFLEEEIRKLKDANKNLSDEIEELRRCAKFCNAEGCKNLAMWDPSANEVKVCFRCQGGICKSCQYNTHKMKLYCRRCVCSKCLEFVSYCQC